MFIILKDMSGNWTWFVTDSSNSLTMIGDDNVKLVLLTGTLQVILFFYSEIGKK